MGELKPTLNQMSNIKGALGKKPALITKATGTDVQILQVSPIDTLVGNNNSSIRFDIEKFNQVNRDDNYSNERCYDPESPIKEDLLD